MTNQAEHITHGPYHLMLGLLDGRLVISRQDPDRKRTVAYIESRAQWDKFVAALDDGADEVAAVHAIDASTPTRKDAPESWPGSHDGFDPRLDI